MKIRPEQPDDIQAIAAVNAAAFGRDAEGDLVAALRAANALTLSLVAIGDAQEPIIGHIAFSPGRVVGEAFEQPAVALGPMSVLPAAQKRGVGSRLVRAGQETLRRQGAGPLFVLGHTTYYPRFGFVPAHLHGVRCEFDVAPEYFMVWAPGSVPPPGLDPRGGIFHYHPEFRGV